MTPKEILLSLFDDQVTPWLEAKGFRFLRSQFSYKRKSNAFTQVISVSLNPRNSALLMVFDSTFSVWSPFYNKWLRRQERPISSGCLRGCAHWNVPGWQRSATDWSGAEGIDIDFTDPVARYAVIDQWKNKCEQAGLPFLERLSSWEGAAEDLLSSGEHYDQAADFFLIGGNTGRAIEALEKGIQFLQKQDFSWSEKAHPILVEKRKRETAGRDAEVALYEQRIKILKNSQPSEEANRLGDERQG
jgi:hypothetical protein